MLVLVVAGVVEREVGKATNESYGLVGAWCGLWSKEKQKKAPTSHYDSLVPVVAGEVEGEATNEG